MKTTLSIYECGEFHDLGKSFTGIKSAEEAVRLWESIDYMYRDAKKRLIGYIRDHGLRQQDLEGCLGDLLDEEWYKINI